MQPCSSEALTRRRELAFHAKIGVDTVEVPHHRGPVVIFAFAQGAPVVVCLNMLFFWENSSFLCCHATERARKRENERTRERENERTRERENERTRERENERTRERERESKGEIERETVYFWDIPKPALPKSMVTRTRDRPYRSLGRAGSHKSTD
jgi:hypothetical protein